VTEWAPQTRLQKWIVIGLTVAIAATRILALARSLWDWDEALFCMALHAYDVAAHHPHPPGFPLFVAAGKLVRLLIHDDFHALRTVSFLAAIFLFPAAVALGRALRFPFAVSVSAGVLLAFLPNVWFYGGTAFSDIFALTLLVAGLAFLMRAAVRPPHSRADFLLGTLLFSCALLVRPQNVLCAYPWFAAAWVRAREKRWGEIAAAALLSIVVVGTGYGIAAKMTGFDRYVQAVRDHQQYVAHVDGFHNPNRPPSLSLFYAFVIDPYDGGKAPQILFVFAVLGLAIPKRRDAEAMATFFPGLVFALFMLNPTGTARLSLGYMPLLALLAADGMARLALGASLLVRKPKVALAVQVLCVALLAGRFIVWTRPALRAVRGTDSPPVQALKWVRQHLPAAATLYVDGGFGPHAEYLLASYDVHDVDGEQDVAKLPPLRNAWYVSDRLSPNANAVNFKRERKKLWHLFTERYFEASVRPVAGTVRFLDGWYDEEGGGEQIWRWMGTHARIELHAIPAGGALRINAAVPIDIETPPTVTVSIDGRPVDRFLAAEHDFSREYRVPPSPDAHVVAFDLDHAVNPARRHLGGDGRDLGLQLRSITWQP
jgi:hypothetical protein